MGNLLMEKLAAEHGQPKRIGCWGKSPLRIYVEEHYDEIRHAMEQGYTYKQLTKSISGITDKQISVGHFTSLLSSEKKRRDKGYYVQYKLGAVENSLWREFEKPDDVKKYVDDMAVKASVKAGYKVSGKIVSMKRMTRHEYERSTKRNNA